MESWDLFLCEIRDGGSPVVDYRRLVGACVVGGTSDSLESCSNVARTLRRSLLGMGGNTASVVRVDLASWA